MPVSSKIYRGRDGFRAEAFIDLKDFGLPGKTLDISTFKTCNGKLTTVASVVERKPDGCISFMMYGDYRKTVKSEKVRCTEKAVTTQQQDVVLLAPVYISEAQTYYAKPE